MIDLILHIMYLSVTFCTIVSVRLYVLLYFDLFFFLMIRRPPRSTRTDTLFPYTTLFRSPVSMAAQRLAQSLARSFEERKPTLALFDPPDTLDWASLGTPAAIEP